MLRRLNNLAICLDSMGLKKEAHIINGLLDEFLNKESRVKIASIAGGVFMHIGGPSGSGKTTLMERIQELYPDFACKDLDEFDEEANKALNLPDNWKHDSSIWTQEIEDDQFALRQKLLDDFLEKNSSRKIILVGHHTEWGRDLQFNARYKILLNTSPEESLSRRIKRDKDWEGAWNFWDDENLKASELEESKRIVGDLQSQGYLSLSAGEVLNLLEDNLDKTASYNKPRVGKKRWSIKYKKKINCSNPKGFSQEQYCRRKSKGGGYKNS